MSKVLDYEDEPKLAELMSAYLEKQAYEHHHLDRGDIARHYIKNNQVDIILLSNATGFKMAFEICKQVRQIQRCSYH